MLRGSLIGGSALPLLVTGCGAATRSPRHSVRTTWTPLRRRVPLRVPRTAHRDGQARADASFSRILPPGMEWMALRAVLSGVHALGAPVVPLSVEPRAAWPSGSRPERSFPGHQAGDRTPATPVRAILTPRALRRPPSGRSADRSGSSSANGVTAILIASEMEPARRPGVGASFARAPDSGQRLIFSALRWCSWP